MLTVQPILAFSDNYIWLLYDTETREAFVVDPGDAQPVINILQDLGLNLLGVLITHHHFDHVGGLAQLLDKYKPVVFGPHNPNIAGIAHPLAEGDVARVLGREFHVMEVPGHTLDHIAFFHNDPQSPLLFCGDTLFAGGCGRMFEGTPAVMHASLQSLAALPSSTRVYCAHEYTLANLAFALAEEPDNKVLQQRIADAQATRERSEPTIPSELALELATNPFLRCTDANMFAAVRARKDNF